MNIDIDNGMAPQTSSSPNQLTVHQGLLYFVANDGVHGKELWRYDVNTAVASMVYDFNDGKNSSDIKNLISFDDRLCFTATDTENIKFKLWC